MHTAICDRLGIELPIFAFSHCRDVVAAVSQAGGFGVLGALAFTADELEVELQWIDAHVGDRPYGIDVVMPSFEAGQPQGESRDFEKQLAAMIPAGHREFVTQLLEEHGVPELPDGDRPRELIGWVDSTAKSQVQVALTHPKVRLIANALGTPPAEVISQIQASGRLVAALCGSVKHALSHKQAGVDLIIAQGHERGAHTGEIGSMVLWPEVIEAVTPTPVLAAGGVGTGSQIAAALAMGAQGVWTGSLWLLVEESDIQPAAQQSYLRAGTGDTIRSRSFTGKPNRMLRNAWTEAWDAPDSPKPLGMPLQYMVTAEAVARTARYASRSQDVAFNAGGQVVGLVNEIRSTRDVMYSLVEGYLEAVDRLQSLVPKD